MKIKKRCAIKDVMEDTIPKTECEGVTLYYRTIKSTNDIMCVEVLGHRHEVATLQYGGDWLSFLRHVNSVLRKRDAKAASVVKNVLQIIYTVLDARGE